jgi:queuine tRNA-ribosyltransferase
VGETKAEMHHILEVVDHVLPEDKPRYLMGVGTPQDLINGVMRGVDIFDCVLPTRLARHKAVFTATGRMNISKAVYARDERPIEQDCACYTCQHFSRAYLRHLTIAKEMLAGTLLSIHNLHTLLKLAGDMRQAIIQGNFESFSQDYLEKIDQTEQ